MDAQWKFDPRRNSVAHVTGFEIVFEGEPESRFFVGSPRCFPSGMSNLEVAVLIRRGFDFYRGVYSCRNTAAPRPILSLKAGRI